VVITRPAEFDAQVKGWLSEAYRVAGSGATELPDEALLFALDRLEHMYYKRYLPAGS